MLRRIRDFLFGSGPAPTMPAAPAHRAPATRRDAADLLRELSRGQVRTLPDAELASLVQVILGDPRLREPLRGNVRFFDSVARHHERHGQLTARQRTGICNILERAYPHNLAVEVNNRWS